MPDPHRVRAAAQGLVAPVAGHRVHVVGAGRHQFRLENVPGEPSRRRAESGSLQDRYRPFQSALLDVFLSQFGVGAVEQGHGGRILAVVVVLHDKPQFDPLLALPAGLAVQIEEPSRIESNFPAQGIHLPHFGRVAHLQGLAPGHRDVAGDTGGDVEVVRTFRQIAGQQPHHPAAVLPFHIGNPVLGERFLDLGSLDRGQVRDRREKEPVFHVVAVVAVAEAEQAAGRSDAAVEDQIRQSPDQHLRLLRVERVRHGRLGFFQHRIQIDHHHGGHGAELGPVDEGQGRPRLDGLFTGVAEGDFLVRGALEHGSRHRGDDDGELQVDLTAGGRRTPAADHDAKLIRGVGNEKTRIFVAHRCVHHPEIVFDPAIPVDIDDDQCFRQLHDQGGIPGFIVVRQHNSQLLPVQPGTGQTSQLGGMDPGFLGRADPSHHQKE